MRRRWHALSGLALSLALAAGAGTVGAQETARERARAVLPPDLFAQVEALASQAGQEGIPPEPLFNKALEGMAKHVPADRLLSAVHTYSLRLREARGALGEMANGPLIVAGADALQRGVGAETLHRLAQERGGEGMRATPVALLVLADLVEAGVPADHALEVLREAMRMRAREQQMLGISGRVHELMRQGRSAQEAAEQVRRMLMRGRGGGGVGPPVPPGSEPLTTSRRRRMMGGGRGGGG